MRICHYPECENYCEGTTDYCASHNYEQRRSAKDAIKLTKQQERKKAQRLAGMKERRTPIKKASEKRADQLALYSIILRKWLPGKKCVRCGKDAECNHHKKGRENEMLLIVKFWLPTCLECHRWIELHPVEAKELGWSLSRTKKEGETLLKSTPS